MFNTASDTNILRSMIGMIGAAALTATIFYGTVGPDPMGKDTAEYYQTAQLQIAANPSVSALSA